MSLDANSAMREEECGVGDTGKPEQGSQRSDSSTAKAHPVDKGWAWMIMIGSFGMHFLTIGYLRSFGILFVEFQKKFGSSSALTSAVSGVQMCSYSLTTVLVVNVVMKRFPVRKICLAGCILESLGISLCSIVPDISYLIFTQGVLFGSGQAMIYCPTLVILSEYFDKRRPIATVISTCGVSAGGVAFPVMTRYLVDRYGLKGALLLLAAAVLQQAVFASFFTPPSDYYFAPTDKVSSDQDYQCAIVDVKKLEGHHSKQGNLEVKDKLHYASTEDFRFTKDKLSDTVISRSLPLHFHFSTSLNEKRSFLEDQNGQEYQHLLPTHLHTEEHLASTERISSASDSQNSIDTRETLQNHKNEGGDAAVTQALLREHRSGSEHHTSDVDFNQTAEKKPSQMLRAVTSITAASGREACQKSSLKTTMMNAYSASSIDLHGVQGVASQQQSHVQGYRGKDSDSEDAQSKKKSFRCHVPVMARTVSFWIVAVFFASGGIASALPAMFLPPLTKEKELDDEAAALFLMVSAVMDLIGRLVPGLVLHFGFMQPSTVVIGPMAVCATVYHFTHWFNDFGTMMTLSILSGLFTGAFWAVQSLVVIEVFGFHRLGPILGFYSIVVGFSVGASFPIGGALRDISGSYTATFHYFGAMYYLAAVMMILVQFTKGDKDKDRDVVSDEDDNVNDCHDVDNADESDDK